MPAPVYESHYDLLRDAIFDNNAERFQELLAVEGVDADHFDAGGQTMLHLASFWGRTPFVKILLSAGASLKTKNAAGCTALDLATHWGHSSVAEIIRLRGGRSVWEEKLGQLQIRVEDLKLQNAQLVAQFQNKKREHEELLDEFHLLHRRHEEEKSAHLGTRQTLLEAQQQCETLVGNKHEIVTELGEVTELFRAVTMEKARADALRDQAQRELQGALEHRDEVLASMYRSVAKQEEITQFWQRAEAAAAIADSQRNFVLAEKEKLQKQHTAALGELVLTTERLHSAEHELMTLRVELAEYIYSKERDQRVVKRATQVLARTEGITTAVLRPYTTPVALPQPVLQCISEKSAPEPNSSEPILNARKKMQFSKAAQAYGSKIRLVEIKKAHGRQRRHQLVENQYLTHGLSTPLAAADKFQETFVSSLSTFANSRDDKWTALRYDRERQSNYATTVMQRRVISTAPLPLRRRVSGNSLGSEWSDADYVPPGSHAAGAAGVAGARQLVPLKSLVKLEHSQGQDIGRSSTSQAEERMRRSFFLDQTSTGKQT